MLLNLTFSILFFSLFALFFIPSSNRQMLRNVSLFSTGSVLVLSCLLLDQFDPNSYYFQYVQNYQIGSELINLTFLFN
jgi:NADH:ubiquinone oxidoreductase subunit 4 (subunit M)